MCSVSKRLLSTGNNPKIMNKWPSWDTCTNWSEYYNNPFLVLFKNNIGPSALVLIKKQILFLALIESQDDGSLSQVPATPVMNNVSIFLVCCKSNEITSMYWLNGACMDPPFPPHTPPPPPMWLVVKDSKKSREQQKSKSELWWRGINSEYPGCTLMLNLTVEWFFLLRLRFKHLVCK